MEKAIYSEMESLRQRIREINIELGNFMVLVRDNPLQAQRTVASVDKRLKELGLQSSFQSEEKELSEDKKKPDNPG